VETIKHRAGLVAVRVMRCTNGWRDMWPRMFRASRGIRCQNILKGSPNRSSGGAKVIRSKCLIMWAVSRLWSYRASGDPQAVQINNKPRKKLVAFQVGIGVAEVERTEIHPRRYTDARRSKISVRETGNSQKRCSKWR